VAGATLVICVLLAGRATAGPVPADFRAALFTAINTRDWWLEGNVPCRFQHGCVAMIRTLNGGHNFIRVHVPTLLDVGANFLGQFAFADSENGYIAGARFWDTHDGGRHWQSVNLRGQVGSVATGGGFVYATVWRKFPRAVLMRSPVGHDDWTVLGGALDGFEGVSVDHGTILLDESVTLGGEQRILISHDQGANFTYSRPLPEVICNPDEPVPGTLWMLCSGGMTDLLFRSTDVGHEFSQPDWNGNPKDAPSLVGLSHSTLGAADATTAVIGSQELLRTTDGGRVFKRLPMPVAAGGWDVGFIDSRHGLALGRFGESLHPPGRLYYTADGGAIYHLIPIRRS